MKVSNKQYAFLMMVLFMAVIVISFAVGGFVGVEHPQNAMSGFRISMIVGLVAISIFHFAKGRRA